MSHQNRSRNGVKDFQKILNHHFSVSSANFYCKVKVCTDWKQIGATAYFILYQSGLTFIRILSCLFPPAELEFHLWIVLSTSLLPTGSVL